MLLVFVFAVLSLRGPNVFQGDITRVFILTVDHTTTMMTYLKRFARSDEPTISCHPNAGECDYCTYIHQEVRNATLKVIICPCWVNSLYVPDKCCILLHI